MSARGALSLLCLLLSLPALGGQTYFTSNGGQLNVGWQDKEGKAQQLSYRLDAGKLPPLTLPIGQLKPGKMQPRTSFEGIDLLVESVKEFGLLQPILVRPLRDAADTYEIIAGERRWRAAQKAQLHDVPVVIRSIGDMDALQLGLIENLQRADLTPIDEALASRAYEDTALPIGNGQTISQPWVVARMTEALIEHGMPGRVLEVGTGSGYQASVLATLGLETYSVERIEELLRVARRRFRNLSLNIRTKHDDGRAGWPEYAPFPGIIVTAGAAALEASLFEQLPEGGTLVAPIGAANGQRLLRIRRIEGALSNAHGLGHLGHCSGAVA